MLMYSLIFIFTIGVFLFLYSLLFHKRKSIVGKHVVITGGSSGIGKALAILALKKGAHVTIIARSTSKLKEALDHIKKEQINNNQKVNCVSCDVTNHSNLTQALNNLEIDVAPIYMLVNCAGLAICGKIEDLSKQDIETMVNINLLGSIYATQVVVPKMKQRKEGIIVFTSSQAGLLGIYGYSVYAASKFAIRGLAESLDMEVRSYNINVCVSLPADTDTPGLEAENKTKPKETKLISESGGLYKPEQVSEKLLNDALGGKFYSYIGFESHLLSTLCIGMTPFASFFEVYYQIFLLGFYRIIASIILKTFHRTIKKSLNDKKCL